MFTFSRSVTVFLALVCGVLGIVDKAAAQYSVYFYNTSRNDGWSRSGIDGQVNVSRQACINAINDRVQQDKNTGNNIWKYGIAPSTAQWINGNEVTVIYTPAQNAPPPQKLWYVDVSFVYRGQHKGYLGGYSTKTAALSAYSYFASNLANFSPRLLYGPYQK